jgi:hypothetical protein
MSGSRVTTSLPLLLLLLSGSIAATVVIPGNVTSSCVPHCVTHCQAPRPPPPDCRVIAAPAPCNVTCTNPTHIRRCHMPVCVTEAPGDQCPADSCPECAIKCSRLSCAPGVDDCGIQCGPATCAWECVMVDPKDLPPAVCDVRCEHPVCGATVAFVNRTRSSSTRLAPLCVVVLLLLLLTLP